MSVRGRFHLRIANYKDNIKILVDFTPYLTRNVIVIFSIYLLILVSIKSNMGQSSLQSYFSKNCNEMDENVYTIQ